MYTGAWKYQSETKQSSCFRGYVYWYSVTGTKIQAPCHTVQKSRAIAEKDANKLLKLLKQNETMDKELIKDIKKWIAKKAQSINPKDEAYALLCRVLADSSDVEKVIKNLKKNVVYGDK